ncbi:MAG TPA: ABC transporter permease [Pseudonocardiaceae bacterium]|nr:ABC transporter permease [Pseudonocardiaceae bacterium]
MRDESWGSDSYRVTWFAGQSVTFRADDAGYHHRCRGAILQQFLIEAMVLAGTGGLIGAMIGIGLSVLAARLAPALGATAGTFAPVVTVPSVMVSVGVSLMIGIVAGGYPANRAARMRPIEALRHQ